MLLYHLLVLRLILDCILYIHTVGQNTQYINNIEAMAICQLSTVLLTTVIIDV